MSSDRASNDTKIRLNFPRNRLRWFGGPHDNMEADELASQATTSVKPAGQQLIQHDSQERSASLAPLSDDDGHVQQHPDAEIEAEESSDEDDEDDDFSDSDDESSPETRTPLTIPQAILDAEGTSASPKPYAAEDHPVDSRYTGFLRVLCHETSTRDARKHTIKGLPYAIWTADSLELGESYATDNDLDVFAFALIIHVWQLACWRLQYGEYPDPDPETSLSSAWGSNTITAHLLVCRQRHVSRADLNTALYYWEQRLRFRGNGNRWLESRWAKDIRQHDEDMGIKRNDFPKTYLDMFLQYETIGLASIIVDEEAKGDHTQLRDMVQASPDSEVEVNFQLAVMLTAMNPHLLKAIIEGQVFKRFYSSAEVYESLTKLSKLEYRQPSIYMNCICDGLGLSPSPAQWQEVCSRMLDYVEQGSQHNALAAEVDQLIHPKEAWPVQLAHQGLRRYTEWRSHVTNGNNGPDGVHRQMVRYFVDQLRHRIEREPENTPLRVPVVEVGYTNNPYFRLRQHRHHESSNYLMNLAQAMFEHVYPGDFTLDQHVVLACFQPIHTWLGEIVITQLAGGYVTGGGGFSHETAGRSNSSAHREVSVEMWDHFFGAELVEGKLEEKFTAICDRAAERPKILKEASRRWRAHNEAQLNQLKAEDAYLDAFIALAESARRMLR